MPYTTTFLLLPIDEWEVLTGYGNGDCVKFISMKAWGLLTVYQGFYLWWARVALGVKWGGVVAVRILPPSLQLIPCEILKQLYP